MIAQARKRHFRTADTQTLDAQFFATAVSFTITQDTQFVQPIIYNIPERATVIQLVCNLSTSLSDEEKFRRKIQAIEARTALCRRREAQRRGRPEISIKQEESNSTANDCDTEMPKLSL